MTVKKLNWRQRLLVFLQSPIFTNYGMSIDDGGVKRPAARLGLATAASRASSWNPRGCPSTLTSPLPRFFNEGNTLSSDLCGLSLAASRTEAHSRGSVIMVKLRYQIFPFEHPCHLAVEQYSNDHWLNPARFASAAGANLLVKD